ncbi:outer membrane protein assembly factor BamA [Aureivirga sp. CE67]|uniref:outer membrane protein assembly factor BamA n=1 Tax=Aureivirga sp. CE67 TaxID=1788983 RepID=UPI0018C91870|nr:outer membrane protein assembly factor BamA [Aureivirga sp. CE67]
MNKLRLSLLLLSIILGSNSLTAQETNNSQTENTNTTSSYKQGETYTLGGIRVVGLQKFSEESIRIYTGLTIGQEIKIPGDKLTSAIKRLYETKKFSTVDVYIDKIDGNAIYLLFEVTELPELDEVTVRGIRKGKAKDLKKDSNLEKGEMVTENLLVTTKNYFEKQYIDKGFLNAKVTIDTRKDSTSANSVDMLINLDKGKRVKVRSIKINGNKAFSNGKVRGAMKNTKKAFFGRFWKTSKFIDEMFKEDLKSIVEAYSEQGYRDAKVIDYKINKVKDNRLDIEITVEEGKQYYFGDIKFIGNSHFKTDVLERYLGIEKGEIYNGKILKERVKGDGTPTSDDITTLYLDSGYLFSRVTPIETGVKNDSINIEIRIYEDEIAILRNVDVSGNDRTNDHVIYRELRTRPGQKFSKTNIIRSIREISQLGFFDAQAIQPDVKPNFQDKTVDIEYSVAEKGSSQIELQAGYGGNAFIGTLGLSFNNFSLRNIFNLKEYKPLPMGDGQKLSLRLQGSRFYTTTSFSFTEPWIGGKRPKSLSFSVYSSRQYGYSGFNDVDRDQSLHILGASVGIGQRLKWPDDYFQLSQTLSYQRYDINNYRFLSFDFNNGVSNNLSYQVSFSRNSSGPDPIFPTTGSEFSITAKATLPYSLIFNRDVDYANETDDVKYKWLEYYKIGFKGKWYTPLIGKSVLFLNTEFGFLGHYNKDIGDSPFERYFVGGDGLANFQLDGRETIALRGYENNALSSSTGGTVYNKFSLEARYPITKGQAATIYTLGFLEAGNSYDGFDNFEPFNLKRSAGLGLRVFMPQFGLLGIDFGYGFDPANEQFNTGISGWQTHFIFGQQF